MFICGAELFFEKRLLYSWLLFLRALSSQIFLTLFGFRLFTSALFRLSSNRDLERDLLVWFVIDWWWWWWIYSLAFPSNKHSISARHTDTNTNNSFSFLLFLVQRTPRSRFCLFVCLCKWWSLRFIRVWHLFSLDVSIAVVILVVDLDSLIVFTEIISTTSSKAPIHIHTLAHNVSLRFVLFFRKPFFFSFLFFTTFFFFSFSRCSICIRTKFE